MCIRDSFIGDKKMFIREDRDNFWILNWLDEFMIGHKGFICGGCFKNIFNKEKVKDLDIFSKVEKTTMMRLNISIR